MADLDIRPNKIQRRRLQLDDEGAELIDTWIERYCLRDVRLETQSLMHVVRNYVWKTKCWKPVRNEKVFNLYFRPDQAKDNDQWCRAKILLHHPFRDVDGDDLLLCDGREFDDYEELYEYCKASHNHPPDLLGDPLNCQFSSSDETLSGTNNIDPNHRDEEILASRNPYRDNETAPLQTDLGQRSEDRNHDWLQRDFLIDIAETRVNIETIHGSNNEDIPAPTSFNDAGDPQSLNAEQKAVFFRVLSSYRDNRGGVIVSARRWCCWDGQIESH